MNRRDLLLQEMGITQWQLKYPERLQGVVNIEVDSTIRLMIISDEVIPAQTALFTDILRSLSLTPAQCLQSPFQQVPHLKMTQPVIYWLLSQDADKMAHTATLCQPAKAVWFSPVWAQFQQDHQAKRQFWQQVQTSPLC